MPVMDGMEALPRLRALCPDATIVVLSGLGAAQTTRRAMAAGADGYLQKGQPMSAVLAYVHDLLDGTAPRPAPPRTHDATPHEDPTRDAAPAPGGGPVPPALPALTAAVQDATYGVLEVLDEPIFRVVWGNKAAEQLLGRPCRPGTPLFAMASALAGHLAQHRGHDDSLDSVPLAAGPVPAVLRRAGGSLLLFLGAAPDDLEALPL